MNDPILCAEVMLYIIPLKSWGHPLDVSETGELWLVPWLRFLSHTVVHCRFYFFSGKVENFLSFMTALNITECIKDPIFPWHRFWNTFYEFHVYLIRPELCHYILHVSDLLCWGKQREMAFLFSKSWKQLETNCNKCCIQTCSHCKRHLLAIPANN